MMLKKLMKNGVMVGVAVGAMALVGCGQGGGSGNGGGSADGASDSKGHADAGGHSDADGHGHGGDAGPAAPKSGGSGSQAEAAAFDDSSADGAIGTYIARLKAGDLLGAAEICLDEAPGTGTLRDIGTQINKMLQNPEEASIAETTRALYVSDFKTLESAKTVEEDGVVVYEVTVINKAPVNVRVELRDGVWRVIPPTGGTPMG